MQDGAHSATDCDPNLACLVLVSVSATRRSDQKLQDVVDKIFPEHRERDEVLEKEFYERHNFKKRKIGDDSSGSDASSTNAASVALESSGEQEASPSSVATFTPVASSSTVTTVKVEGATRLTATAAALLAAAATSTMAFGSLSHATASAAVATSSSSSSSSSSALKRNLKFSQRPLSDWSTTILKLFTIKVYPEKCGMRELPKLQRPYLHVDGRFKSLSCRPQMFELRKYITKTLKLEQLADELEMTCLGAIVGPELSVHFIHRTIWQHKHEGKPLVLHYRHVTS